MSRCPKIRDETAGNVILLTDERAQPAARYSYDAFGQTITATGPAASVNRYRFSTKPTENGSGLAYYGYRYYDPVSERWPSRDPIGELGGYNLHSSVNNNSISSIDKLGNEPVTGVVTCCVVVGVAVAGYYAWCHAEAKDAACMAIIQDFKTACRDADDADRATCELIGGKYKQGASQSQQCGQYSYSGPCGGGDCELPDPQPIDLNVSGP